MRLYYPDKPQIEVMQALPRWAWNRILERAQELHIRRTIWHPGPHQLNLYHRTVRYDDLMAVEQLMQGEEEKERIHSIVNQLAQQTMRGGVSAHWFLPLDSISYAAIDAALDDGAEKLHVSAAACESRRQSVIYGLPVNLTRIREITQDLVELFGLTLPALMKK